MKRIRLLQQVAARDAELIHHVRLPLDVESGQEPLVLLLIAKDTAFQSSSLGEAFKLGLDLVCVSVYIIRKKAHYSYVAMCLAPDVILGLPELPYG